MLVVEADDAREGTAIDTSWQRRARVERGAFA